MSQIIFNLINNSNVEIETRIFLHLFSWIAKAPRISVETSIALFTIFFSILKTCKNKMYYLLYCLSERSRTI